MNYKYMKRILTFSLLCLLSFVMVESTAQSTPDLDEKYAVDLLKPGTPAPDFQLATPDGKMVKFSDFAKGKYVVVDFWASWCPDCRKDAPEIIRIYNHFHAKGVEFIGVSFDTDKEKWKNCIEKLGIPYEQVSELKRMKDSKVAEAYGIHWIPSVYLIGPDGKVLVSTVLSYKIEKKLWELFEQPLAHCGTTEKLLVEGSRGKLSAVLRKPSLKAGEKCDLVILCHGFNANKEFSLLTMAANQLQADGIASLMFDFNGHGESDGAFKDMTIPNELADLDSVLAYIGNLPFVQDVALVGHSQGGVVAAMAAGNHPDRIKSVVLLAPAAVLREDAIRGNLFGTTYNPLDPPESIVLWNGLEVGGRYLSTASRLPIYETAAKYNGSACIIHGTGDILVPYTYGERFHQIWPSSEYYLLDYYDHNFTGCPYRPVEIMVEFLEKTLR